MTTSVKINEEDKRKLEKLQALITIKAGRKLTQQSLLSELINEAFQKSDRLVEKITNQPIPVSDKEYKKMLSLIEDWGVKTSWEDIDKILYGRGKGNSEDL